MELREYLEVLRRNWIVILAATAAGLLVGGLVSLTMSPIYTSSTSVFVSIQTSGSGSSGSELSAGTSYIQNQVKTFAQVATSDRVLQPVIEELDLNTSVGELSRRVTATAPLDLVIIDISVSDESPGEAAKIANAIGDSLIAVIADLSKPESGPSPVKISKLTPALSAQEATSPNIRLNLAVGLVIGLLLGLAYSILRKVLDTRVHNAHDVSQITDAPVLGGIVFDEEAKTRPLVVQVSPQSPRAEAFRQLRTNLQFVGVAGEGRTFLVTSSMPSEGKSSTSVNLAITLAEAGSKVLLIDGDLRRPKVAEYMGIEGAVGLTDHLIGRADLEDVVQPWGAGMLHILPAGQVPPNPSELLGSKAMVDLLQKLDLEYDAVLIDAPPLLPVTDAAILSKLVSGGAMMVVGSGKISKHQLAAATSSLATIGGHLVGVILNLLPKKGVGTAGYYGYYGYESQPTSSGNSGV